MSSPTLIDDSHTAVQYSPGWIWDQLVHDEVDHTRHGAAIPDITVSLGFTGTGIDVVGTLEPTDRNGRPTTTYNIDGKDVETYTAPFTATGDTQFNVTFFSKRDLDPGNHRLVVTNMNGSSPNIFWLDYFLVFGSPSQDGVGGASPSSSSTSSSAATSTSSSDDSTGTQPFISLQKPESTVIETLSQPTNTNISAGSSASDDPSSSNNVGAIVGGVVGGLGVLLLLAILILLLRRRQRRSSRDSGMLDPPPQPYPPPHQPSLSPIPPSAATYSPGADLENPPQMTSATSATASRPPMSVVGSSAYTASLSDVNSAPHTNLTTASTALASSDVMPLTSAQAKLQESIYSSSSGISRTGTSTTRSAAQSDTQLISPTESSLGPVTPASDAPLVHEEVSRAPWYAPAKRQSRAESLLRAFSARQGSSSRSQASVRDVDSGLRLYSEPALPPPYTPD
ncbi:hypothetical protein C8Q76DRAFT_804068 [Earliella scabrosa]|nr:hypothetical protein C8Q76DRAFT_804068 [Earliella scabrosa]